MEAAPVRGAAAPGGDMVDDIEEAAEDAAVEAQRNARTRSDFEPRDILDAKPEGDSSRRG